MTIEIAECGPDILERYSTIPITFRVDSVLRVVEHEAGLGGLTLREDPVIAPFEKEYDRPGRCVNWPRKFDVANWGFLLATDGPRAVGGAVMAYHTPDVTMLDDREDLTVLWDLRVQPDLRGQGIGTRLFKRAAEWARARQCTQLKVETQTVNVRACRFYARQGCHLGAIHRHAYAHDPSVADEVMTLWYLDL